MQGWKVRSGSREAGLGVGLVQDGVEIRMNISSAIANHGITRISKQLGPGNWGLGTTGSAQRPEEKE